MRWNKSDKGYLSFCSGFRYLGIRVGDEDPAEYHLWFHDGETGMAALIAGTKTASSTAMSDPGTGKIWSYPRDRKMRKEKRNLKKLLCRKPVL